MNKCIIFFWNFLEDKRYTWYGSDSELRWALKTDFNWTGASDGYNYSLIEYAAIQTTNSISKNNNDPNECNIS